MKFNWIASDITKKMNECSCNNEESIKRYFIYRSMLSDLERKQVISFPNISRNDFFAQLNNFDSNYFDNSFFNSISYVSSKIGDYEIKSDVLLRDKKTPDYVIKICKDFYKRNDRDSLYYFRKIVSQDNTINFLNYNEHNNFLGRTYIISAREFYILINGFNYLEDCLSMIHEGKHVEMKLKGYDNGITLYQELPSILYELYMIDYLFELNDNKSAILELKIRSFNKYIEMIKRMTNQMEFIKQMKLSGDKNNTYQNVYENYYLYYDKYNFRKIYDIIQNGYSQKEIGTIISFLVATDIYINSKICDANNALSCYIFGLYKMKPSVIDNALEYITSLSAPYKKEKNKKKYKNPIDKL